MMSGKPFIRQFRIYLKNNHPAYIVDEEENLYAFHRVTHSKASGGKKNWRIDSNPIKGHICILLDKKSEILKADLVCLKSNLKMVLMFLTRAKKVGRTQIQSNVDRATITSDIQIKTNNSKKGNKK